MPKKSKYRVIFELLIAGEYIFFISNDILSEYTEIIESKTNALVATNIAEMLLNLENVRKIDIYYEWKLIYNDPDDNKYVDAALSSGADFLISNDQHFKVLAQIDFPKVNLLTIEEFLQLLNQQQERKKVESK
ncbi:putative toxin-antitoxin system toxin component, PIN family [Adhaeribacter arboris]|uniref:Putative toxin-antitoxin system toxin component, PIN family n=1 Tax=Adhaeribacter arboris TaxID=2072846 RepID=A0A2T2YJ73_9BACT|nr:putative toxin-antitoxin system toxin component, PIN family [Adhaeribacter arboris]PSR55551.1 putative toxin-antitoxin system toxin component, PIN family [Adhaeribacter arboris]